MKTPPSYATEIVTTHQTPSENLDQVTEQLKGKSSTCFPHNAGSVFLRMNINGRNGTYHIILHVSEDRAKAFALCDLQIPESTQPKVAEYIRCVNCETLHGSFELNEMNGELQYRDSIKDEALNPAMIQALIAATLLAMDHYFPAVLGVCRGLMHPGNAVHEDSLTLNV